MAHPISSPVSSPTSDAHGQLTTLLHTYPQTLTHSLALALKNLYLIFTLTHTLAAASLPPFRSSRILFKIWQAITLTNQHFRTQLSNLQFRPQPHISKSKSKPKPRPVELRKLRSTYLKFLIRAQDFLVALVCVLSENEAMPGVVRGVLAGDRRFRGRVREVDDQGDAAGGEGPERKQGKALVKACYDAIVYLGDLSRYREQLRNKNGRMEYALEWMDLAVGILPRQGAAWHQRAMVYIKGEGTECQMQTIWNLHRAASVRYGTADAVTSLRVYLERLKWGEQSGGSAGSDVHQLLRLDDPKWTEMVSRDTLFSTPFSKGGFLIDLDGVRRIEV